MAKLLEQVRRRSRSSLQLSRRKDLRSLIRQYIFFNQERHPAEPGPEAVSSFLSHLAGKVAASTQNEALAALLFLYRLVLQKNYRSGPTTLG